MIFIFYKILTSIAPRLKTLYTIHTLILNMVVERTIGFVLSINFYNLPLPLPLIPNDSRIFLYKYLQVMNIRRFGYHRVYVRYGFNCIYRALKM